MTKSITARQLVEVGLEDTVADAMARRINPILSSTSGTLCWQRISKEVLKPEHPFAVHGLLYDLVFSDWDNQHGPRPAWSPTEEFLKTANIQALMGELGISTYREFHDWSVQNREAFWQLMVNRLGIQFQHPPTRILDPSSDEEFPRWFVDAQLNIVDTCLATSERLTAIVYRTKGGALSTWSFGELRRWTNRVAGGLVKAGFKPGDAVGICMPMTAESVAIYLGIIKVGCVVISIAESFAAEGIATRLKLGTAKGLFTQDFDLRGRKPRRLYEKVCLAGAPTAIVVPSGDPAACELRNFDIPWDEFLGDEGESASVAAAPESHTNILFSSGTTGEPKSIPWTQTTPIKCAADAYLHHNIQPSDVLAWPSSLGWMMGPWLIYASLINRASMALHYGAPTGRDFCEFVQDAKVTMLGVVPSLVKTWRNAKSAEGLDWQSIKAFSSTGECSQAEDMLYLMSLAGYKPIIEYCGGTEIGGGYITGTMVQPASPSTFSTPALGLDVAIFDERGADNDNGELFIVPPSIGLSNELLNRDHHQVYFADTPNGLGGVKLRRHGDQMERLPGGYYRAHGRVDDTMNLGGIKISSAEIERVLNSVVGIQETGAISSSPPGGGPERLIVYAVPESVGQIEASRIKTTLQAAITSRLNPLFKINTVVFVDSLPRTASNKVMRRELRRRYETSAE